MGWWLTGLFDLDEGFYAAVVAEMNRRGEWVTPYYNGQPWFEKPILLYWLAKPCVALFGDMFGPRLPSVLSTIGCYLLVVGYCRRRISDDAATWSIFALSSSLVFVAVGRLMMTDMPLVLAFSAALMAFWESLKGERRWRILTAGLLGIAVLAKGPVALILFGLIAGWTYWREPSLRPAFRGHWLVGILALICVISVWYVPAYLANGKVFVDEFLIKQNIGRFTGGDAAHTIKAAWAYILYIPVIFVGMFPWSIWLWKAWPRRSPSSFSASETLNAPESLSRENEEGGSGVENPAFLRYLASWAAIVFLFFTVSGAKLPHYVLPVFVPLAMLLGAYFSQKWPLQSVQRVAWPIAWVTFVGVLANTGFLWWYAESGQQEAHAYARYIKENSLRKVPKSTAMFQMPRRSKALGTGKPKLQETSLPSFLLYIDGVVTQAETVAEVINAKDHWLFTRAGRITDAVQSEFLSSGKQLQLAGPIGFNFELYEILNSSTPKPPPPFPEK